MFRTQKMDVFINAFYQIPQFLKMSGNKHSTSHTKALTFWEFPVSKTKIQLSKSEDNWLYWASHYSSHPTSREMLQGAAWVGGSYRQAGGQGNDQWSEKIGLLEARAPFWREGRCQDFCMQVTSLPVRIFPLLWSHIPEIGWNHNWVLVCGPGGQMTPFQTCFPSFFFLTPSYQWCISNFKTTILKLSLHSFLGYVE